MKDIFSDTELFDFFNTKGLSTTKNYSNSYITSILKIQFYDSKDYWNELYAIGLISIINSVLSYSLDNEYSFSDYTKQKIVTNMLYYNQEIKSQEQSDTPNTKSFKTSKSYINYILSKFTKTEIKILLTLLKFDGNDKIYEVLKTYNLSFTDVQVVIQKMLLKLNIYLKEDSFELFKKRFKKSQEKDEKDLENKCGIRLVKNSFRILSNLQENPNRKCDNKILEALEILQNEYSHLEQIDKKNIQEIFGLEGSESKKVTEAIVSNEESPFGTEYSRFERTLYDLSTKIEDYFVDLEPSVPIIKTIKKALITKEKIKAACDYFRSSDTNIKYENFSNILSLDEWKFIEFYFSFNKDTLTIEELKKHFNLDTDEILKILDEILIKVGNSLKIKDPESNEKYKKYFTKINNFENDNNLKNSTDIILCLLESIGGNNKSKELVLKCSLKVLDNDFNNTILELNKALLCLKTKNLKIFEKKFGFNSNIAESYMSIDGKPASYYTGYTERIAQQLVYILPETKGYSFRKEYEKKVTDEITDLLTKLSKLKIGNKHVFRITPTSIEKILDSSTAEEIYPEMKYIFDNLTITEKKVIILHFGFNGEYTYTLEEIKDALEIAEDIDEYYFKILEKIYKTYNFSLEIEPLNHKNIEKFYKKYKEFPKEYVDDAIFALKKENHDYLISGITDNKRYKRCSSQIRKHIDKRSGNNEGLQKLYNHFFKFNKELIDVVFNHLKERDQSLIRLMFQSNICKSFPSWNGKKKSIDYNKILALMTDKLIKIESLKNENLFDQFPKSSLDKVIDSIIFLNEEEKYILKKLFKNSYDQPPVFDNLELIYQFIYVIVPRIRGYLISNCYGTIFEYFKDYTKEEVYIVINSLSSKEKKILHLRFGPDFEEPSRGTEWDKLYVQEFEKLLDRMRTKLYHNRNSIKKPPLKSIYDIFKNHTKEQIDYVISTLRDEEKDLLHLKYGPDLSHPVESPEWNDELQERFKKLLKKISGKLFRLKHPVKKVNKFKSLYKLLSQYSKEEIDIIIKECNPEEKELLNLIYDNDLSNPIEPKEWNQELEERFQQLVKDLRQRLRIRRNEIRKICKKKNIKTIYERLSNYSNEVINQVIESLNDEDKYLLYLKYGSDLEHPVTSPLWNSEKHDYAFQKLLKKISYRAKKLTENKHIKTIYEIFSNYSKEEIDSVIETLTKEEKYLLYLRYGSDLEHPVTSPLWNTEYSTLFEKLIKRIKKKLIKLSKKTIYERLSNYSKEVINQVIESLSVEEKYLLFLRYGSDLEHPVISPLWNPEEHDFAFQKLLRKIGLKAKKLTESKCIKTIYERLNDYSKEEIDSVIETLTKEEKYLLYLRYGNDLEHPITSPLWNKEYSIEFDNLINRIRRKLKNLNKNKIKTIYERLSDYSKEEIDSVIETLTKEEKYLLFLRYGNDLEHPVINPLWTAEHYIEFEKLFKRISRKLKNLRSRIKTIYNLLNKYSKEEIDLTIETLNDEEKYILYLRYGSDLEHPVTSPLWSDEKYQSCFEQLLLLIEHKIIQLRKTYENEKVLSLKH